MSVPCLSEQHLEAVTAAMAQDEAIGVADLITDGPEGDFEYHINVGDGAASMGRGALNEPDVSITSSYQTAAKLGRRETSSQMAFMTGKIKVKGSVGALMKNMALMQKIESHAYSVDVDY